MQYLPLTRPLLGAVVLAVAQYLEQTPSHDRLDALGQTNTLARAQLGHRAEVRRPMAKRGEEDQY